MVLIRDEIAADYDDIREVNRIAFGGNEEAEIVDRLRRADLVVTSLVAVENEQVVGHIMSSDLSHRNGSWHHRISFLGSDGSPSKVPAPGHWISPGGAD